ncbi:MAG TPA: hypothetical protein DCM02_14015 [Flavobacterium sp.]|nr:hypothetical protein [Flavobacterium sp.]
MFLDTSGLLCLQYKTYSLCDSVSFIVMREQGITEALTTDRHFEQEGFNRLLRLMLLFGTMQNSIAL